jgi:hypothetical protein
VGQRPKKGQPVPPPRRLSEGKRNSKHEEQFAVSATMSKQFRQITEQFLFKEIF